MRQFLLACAQPAMSLGALAQDPDSATRHHVNVFTDEWHDDAAHARMAYFDKIIKDFEANSAAK